jgi:hypothetical protein
VNDNNIVAITEDENMFYVFDDNLNLVGEYDFTGYNNYNMSSVCANINKAFVFYQVGYDFRYMELNIIDLNDIYSTYSADVESYFCGSVESECNDDIVLLRGEYGLFSINLQNNWDGEVDISRGSIEIDHNSFCIFSNQEENIAIYSYNTSGYGIGQTLESVIERPSWSGLIFLKNNSLTFAGEVLCQFDLSILSNPIQIATLNWHHSGIFDSMNSIGISNNKIYLSVRGSEDEYILLTLEDINR